MELSDLIEKLKAYPMASLTGFIAVVLGLYLYFTLNSLSELKTVANDLEHEVQILKSNIKEGADIQSDLETYQALDAKIDSRLLDRNQIANNTGYFYALAQNHPIELLSVSQDTVIVENEKPEEGEIWTLKNFAVIPFGISSRGLLTELLDFMYLLETGDRFVSIKSFNIRLSGSGDPGYMDLDFKMHVLGKAENREEKK